MEAPKRPCTKYYHWYNITHPKLYLRLIVTNATQDMEVTKCYILTFDPAQKCYSKVIHQKEVTFQWPVIERDCVGGLRLMIWDKVKVPLCHYSDAPEENNLWTAWQLFPLDDD